MSTAQRFTAALIALLLSATAIVAQQSGTTESTVSARIDWPRSQLIVTVTEPIPTPGPAAASRAGRRAEREALSTLPPALAGIRYDSYSTLGELAEEDPRVAQLLLQTAAEADAASYRPALDLSSVDVQFTFSLFPTIGGAFVAHEEPLEPPRRVGPSTASQYTGLVIYAADELPVHGTDRSQRTNAALFPGLYDQDLTRLLERQYLDPEYLSRWGAAAYIALRDYQGVESEEPYRDRIGDSPLRVLARGVFGRYATDPIIPSEAAETLLAEANRHILAEGRILIIIDTPAATESFEP